MPDQTAVLNMVSNLVDSNSEALVKIFLHGFLNVLSFSSFKKQMNVSVLMLFRQILQLSHKYHFVKLETKGANERAL